MTLTLYILGVPEFAPIVRTAEAAGMVAGRVGDYVTLTARTPEAILRRDEKSTRPALWHAALTGGLDGRIVSYTSDELHLAAGEIA
ncbi:hypothetical protein AB0J38_33835 [Streptomyces sp. NPDC050095]|uniref:hypothetical protein n=1 Tax=unclassified Streptomyces TaxID=2593676 RepID=UPI003413DE96